MDKKIRYQIEFAKASEVESITATDIIMKSGKTILKVPIYTSKLTQTKKITVQGEHFEQKLVLKDVIPSDTLKRMKYPHILKLHLFDGTFFIWGSLENPVIIPDLSVVNGGAELLLYRQSTVLE